MKWKPNPIELILILSLLLGPVLAASADATIRVLVKNTREGYSATISGTMPPYVGYKWSQRGGAVSFKKVPPGRFLVRVELECGASIERVVDVPSGPANRAEIKLELNPGDALFPHDWTGGEHAVSVTKLARSREAEKGLKDAWLHMENAQTGQARFALRKVLRTEPDCVDAWTNLGLVAEWEGSLEEAERFHRQALRLNPNSFATNLNLSEVLEKLEKNHEAIEFGRRAIAIRPHDLGGNLHLGTLLAHSGELRESIVYFEAARKLQPESLGDAQIALAVAYVETNEYKKAIAELDDWLAKNPNHCHQTLIRGVLEEIRIAVASGKSMAGEAPIRHMEANGNLSGPPSQ